MKYEIFKNIYTYSEEHDDSPKLSRRESVDTCNTLEEISDKMLIYLDPDFCLEPIGDHVWESSEDFPSIRVERVD